MNEALARPRPRHRAAAALPLIAAIAGVVAYLLLPPGGRTRELGGEALVAAANLVAGASMLAGARAEGSWRNARRLGVGALLFGATAAALLAFDLSRRGLPAPGPGELVLLVLLVPVLSAVRSEFGGHLSPEDRREVAIDAGLISASLASICYLLLRPTGASADVAIAAAAFAILAAVLSTAFGVLSLWIPRPAHLVQWVVFTGLAAATTAFGWEWTHASFGVARVPTGIAFIACAPALAAAMHLLPRDEHDARRPPGRLARPILTSVSVASACVALAVVAALDDPRRLSRPLSTAIILVLGLGVAVRILANQIRSSNATRVTERALADKGRALAEADRALDRVREANETLRESEEHLRLVFDAAVDGIVELDDRDVILRANDAFSRMVRMDRSLIEGQRWSAVAAVITGADASFASLPSTGQGTIERSEGQPLYLESRISDVPMSPQRRLLLVRDVTAGRVADQTIRSLFQFLQDRDEDRTRLLRRTNVAIEAERNRIARDLHDGPVQGVSAASLSLEAALLMIKAGETERGIEVLTKIRRELAEEADGLRRLMSGLRPPVLEERGLIPALRETLVRFGTEQGIQTEFAGALARHLPDDLETLAYRVVQEALSNAGKHAEAVSTTVTVETDQNQLRIEVADDGRGFESARAREFLRMGRVGLASMRERVELAGGTFVVRSAPGRGTTIVASLPIEAAVSPGEADGVMGLGASTSDVPAASEATS